VETKDMPLRLIVLAIGLLTVVVLVLPVHP